MGFDGMLIILQMRVKRDDVVGALEFNGWGGWLVGLGRVGGGCRCCGEAQHGGDDYDDDASCLVIKSTPQHFFGTTTSPRTRFIPSTPCNPHKRRSKRAQSTRTVSIS